MRPSTIAACVAGALVHTAAAIAEEPWPAGATVERRALGGAGRLVVSDGVGAPVAVVCRVEGTADAPAVTPNETTPEAASPPPQWALEFARRGGSVSDEPLSLRRAWCAAVPTPELGFALFWAARLGTSPRRAEPPGELREPPLALVTRLERIALGGADPGAPAFVLSVVASHPAAEVLALVERHFRVDPAPTGPARPAPRQSSERFAVVTAELGLPLVHTGWVTPDDGASRSAALAVALDVLGEERLPNTLVARSLARRVEAWAGGAPGRALMGFAIEPGSKTSIDRVRRFVDGTLKQMRLVGPSAGEASRAARRLELRAAQIWEHPLLRARELARQELTRGDARGWLAEVAALRAVAPEAVRAAAHAHLVDARRTTVEAYPSLWPADDPRVREHRLHTVVKGDTLFDLARRFGVAVAAIARANDLDPDRVLPPGQGLWIPPPPPRGGGAQEGSAPSLPSRR